MFPVGPRGTSGSNYAAPVCLMSFFVVLQALPEAGKIRVGLETRYLRKNFILLANEVKLCFCLEGLKSFFEFHSVLFFQVGEQLPHQSMLGYGVVDKRF